MTTETMREAVARSLWFDFVDQHGYPNGLPTWDEMVAWPADDRNNRCEEFRSLADAAIRTVLERLREPSDAMLAAAVPEPVWLYEGRPKDYPDQMRVAVAIERAAAFQRWRTMVEAMEEELGLTKLDAAITPPLPAPADSGRG